MSQILNVTLHIGGLYATNRPALIKTVLGSCIAACLFDPLTKIGGMNHFMLPIPPKTASTEENLGRFGDHAMELLIGEIQKLGGERRRLRAKLFGGAHVLATEESAGSVPQRNIKFIEEFMRVEGVPILAKDLGGTQARRVHFQPHTGLVFVKKVASSALQATRMEEARARADSRQTAPKYGELTLWDD